jgi:hypothetical protein
MGKRESVIYWVVVSLLLILIFGASGGSYIYSFYFCAFYMPVVIASSLCLNNILVPEYLLAKRYWLFVLLLLLLIIVSLNLVMVIVFLAFMLLSIYDKENISLVMDNFRLFPLVMYLALFLSGFISLAIRYISGEGKEKIGGRSGTNRLEVRADRRNVTLEFSEIIYLESMSDYVRIFLREGERVITRRTISSLSAELPESFIRIHRSYIINRGYLQSWTRDNVIVGGVDLPVSRTYRKEALAQIEAY